MRRKQSCGEERQNSAGSLLLSPPACPRLTSLPSIGPMLLGHTASIARARMAGAHRGREVCGYCINHPSTCFTIIIILKNI
jgi:hypothetical protein